MINRIPEVKQGATTYRVEETHRISEKQNEIPAGYLLRECIDGKYQVFKEDGEKYFFRVQKKLFEKLKTIII